MEDVKTYLDAAESKMELTVEHLDETLAHIRAGKASPKLLDNIRVDYYGSMMPISGAANVQVPDARTIVITPWEKAMFRVIEKAIKNGMPEDVSKDGEAAVQKLHDKMMKRLDELFAAKEKEILTV